VLLVLELLSLLMLVVVIGSSGGAAVRTVGVETIMLAMSVWLSQSASLGGGISTSVDSSCTSSVSVIVGIHKCSRV
jgi:hypothetical protein